MRQERLRHRFVEFIPEILEDGVVYVSIEYMTVTHKCCCGCGREVVTPLSPTDWRIIFDGKTISLEPSVGNWSLPCQSHYWIMNNQVRWAGKWTQERIRAGRAQDAKVKQTYFGRKATKAAARAPGAAAESDNVKPGRWERFKAFFRQK
jgi:hypothetical protein